MPILFDNASSIACPDGELLALASFAFEYMKMDAQAELSILAVDEVEMERLHVEWMGEPGPTDVLSFPIDELRPQQELKPDQATLGDVVICPAVAVKQAKSAGHSFEDEMYILLVHGILHLMGFDHLDEREEAEMFGLQRSIISAWEGKG